MMAYIAWYGTGVPIKLLNTGLQKIHYSLELSDLMTAGGPHEEPTKDAAVVHTDELQ